MKQISMSIPLAMALVATTTWIVNEEFVAPAPVTSVNLLQGASNVDSSVVDGPFDWARVFPPLSTGDAASVFTGPVYLDGVIIMAGSTGLTRLLDGQGNEIVGLTNTVEGSAAGGNIPRTPKRIALGVVVDGLQVISQPGSRGPTIMLSYRAIPGSIANADVTTTGATLEGQSGYARPDGNVDLDDLGFFLTLWLAAT
ncbi:MAG: hypothetical protein AAGB51_05830 [Planctomycetota bacterium]